jgi:hypothetical protein
MNLDVFNQQENTKLASNAYGVKTFWFNFHTGNSQSLHHLSLESHASFL